MRSTRNMKDNNATKIIPIKYYTFLLCTTKNLNVIQTCINLVKSY